MTTIIIELVYSLALLVALSVVSGFVDARWRGNTRLGALLQGVIFGGAAVVGMMHPFVVAPGLSSDGRSVVISLGALFFGPWTAVVACLMTIPFCLIQGDAGVGNGVLVIVASAAIGVGFHLRWLRRPREVSAMALLGFGVAVHLAVLAAALTLPRDMILPLLKNTGWLVMLTFPLVTVLIGKILSDQSVRGTFVESLQRSERRFRAVFNSSYQSTALLTPDGMLTEANQTALDFSGLRAEEVVGRPFWESRWWRGDEARVRQLREAITRAGRGECVRYEVPVRGRDKSAIIDFSIKPVFDSGDHVALLIAEGRDITTRKHAEEALRQSEQRLRTIVDGSPIPQFGIDREHRVIYWNRALGEITGIKAEDVIGTSQHWRAFYPAAKPCLCDLLVDGTFEAIPEQNRAKYKRFRHAADAYEATEFLPSLGESGKWLYYAAALIRDTSGNVIGAMETLEDITERMRAETELRARQAELATLFENSPVMMCLLDSGHVLRRVNHTLARYAGRPAAELVGARIGELLGCAHIAGSPEGCGSTPHCLNCTMQDMVQQTLQTGQEYRQVESRCVLTRSGQPKERVLTCSTARVDVDRQPVVLLCLEDVTEKKQTEARLLRAQRVESIGSLASGVAHDLNNILAPIVMCAPMLRSEGTPDVRQELAQTIESSAQRAVGIVRQLLSFGRGREGRRMAVQVRHLVRDMAKMARETFPRYIQVQEDCAPDLWPVVGDATQLHQVIMNLCVNARDAMPTGGRLILRADNVTLDEHFVSMHKGATPGPHVRLRVTDTGSGIPETVQEHIFESFYTTKEEGQGTGLGLTTVQGIVQEHLGFVAFTTSPETGTTFEVHLPAVPEAEAQAEAARAQEVVPRGQGELVLVADDEAAVCSTIRRTLEQHGYAVLQAHDGIEALAQFSAHQKEVRVVVADFMMPLMDGVTLCRTLRALSPRTPIIVSAGGLFGNPGRSALRAFEELGVLHILHKPHTADVLLRALGEVLQEPGTPSQEGGRA